jgi:4-hydroxy-2-oxoheptanedioate aldolase
MEKVEHLQPNWLKRKLNNKYTVLGPFCKLSEPAIYEIAGLAKFDFAIIDMEHGPISFETAQNLIRTCELVGLSPVIRVPKNEDYFILKALDIGAHGVQVPEINTKEQAQKLVKASRYYPQGNRGVCRFVRAAEYSSKSKEEYFNTANENVVVIAHIEGKEGIDNLSAILDVEGIDIVFIGPYDLSQSLGITGQTNHPKLVNTMKNIVNEAIGKNKIVGTFVESPSVALTWMKQGILYISYSVDVGLILDKFTDVVNSINNIKE